MSVLAFKPPEKPDPHLAGEARCFGCGHQWAAAAPVGTWQLECPGCGAMKGVWRYPVGAQEGDEALVCNCGCEALTAYRRAGHTWLRCMQCGEDQTETFFG